MTTVVEPSTRVVLWLNEISQVDQFYSEGNTCPDITMVDSNSPSSSSHPSPKPVGPVNPTTLRRIKIPLHQRSILSLTRGRRQRYLSFSKSGGKRPPQSAEEQPNKAAKVPGRLTILRRHNTFCGCPHDSISAKNLEMLHVENMLREAEQWGDLRSPSDKAYDFNCPELPRCKPKHRSMVPTKSCLKKVPPVRFCDDLNSGESDSDYSSSSEDDSDTDSICHSFDGDNASRAWDGLMPFGKAKGKEEKVLKYVQLGPVARAICLRTGQSMPATPRTPQNDWRLRQNRSKLAIEKMYRELCRHSSGNDAEVTRQPPGPDFTEQDLEVNQRLRRAKDYCHANERAAIGRGALDFFIYVCRDKNAKCKRIVMERLFEHRSSTPIVGSYLGEERRYANSGTSGVSPVPSHLYRDCESSMSWVKEEDKEPGS
ncbi:hypothetical protein ACHAPT_001315 [Fusarium lateritium]